MRALALVVLASCAKPTPVECPAAAASEFTATFDEGTLEASWPGTIEAPSSEALRLVTTTPRRGARALEFRVTAQATVNSGTRAELAWDSRDLEGSRAQYFFSERLDATWPDFDRVKDAKGRPTWQILAQFHDQPDCTLGETWDSYAGSGNSPPIVVQSFWLTKQDPDVRAVFDSGKAAGVVGLSDATLERPLLGLLVGVPAELRAVVPIEKAKWVDQRLDITWSRGSTGRVTWSVNGTVITTVEGRNMINAAPHYFKAGLYRNPDLMGDQVGQLDEVFVTHDALRADAFERELAKTR